MQPEHPPAEDQKAAPAAPSGSEPGQMPDPASEAQAGEEPGQEPEPEHKHALHLGNVPELCFGLLHHNRLRPVVNAFEYGTYFVRLPLRSMEGNDFGTRVFTRNKRGLLSFYDSDHGDGKQPLLQWIDGLLDEEGVLDADGEIWLQAMPRVLGYVYNPVSFWFCHRADGALRAVLCDIRNTFGERHFYLLENGGEIKFGTELTAKKVLHGSPFCPPEGRYRFRFFRRMRMVAEANGMQREREQTLACIDFDDGAGAMLKTSWSGLASAINVVTALRAFAGYPLQTVSVIARIYLQALRLYFWRLPVYGRTAPPGKNITR